MGLLDAIGHDQTTVIKYSDYYELMKRAVLADILIKGMQEGVPVEHLKKIAEDKTERTKENKECWHMKCSTTSTDSALRIRNICRS